MKRSLTLDDKFFKRPDFPLAVRKERAQNLTPLHYHTFEELVLIESGTADHLVNRAERFPIMAGDVFTIKPNSAHGYANPANLALVNILFHPDRLSLPFPEMRKLPGYHALFDLEPKYRRGHRFSSRLRLCLTDLKHALDLVREMEKELTQRSPGYEFASLSSFMRLIAFLCRCYSRSTAPQSLPLLRVDKALQYLESHYPEAVSIYSLTDQTHQSVNSLLRDFKAATGQSPIQYLLHLRLRKAADLLIERPELNITEAALAVGFNDSNYFTRQFRQKFEINPRSFKKAALASLGDLANLRESLRRRYRR